MNNLLSIQSFLRIDYKILIVLIILIFSFIVEPRLFVNGIFLGLILGVGSMGLTLSYGITKFANIAHGDFMTFGAYISYFVLEQFFPSTNGFGPFSFGGSLLLALPISTVIVAIFALISDIGIFSRLRKRNSPGITMAIASLGIAIALRGLIQMIWSSEVRNFPNSPRSHIKLPFEITIAPNHLFIGVTALLLMLSVYILLNKTKLGKAMRATADNADLARVSGIPSELILRLTWILAGGLAGIAGVLLVIFNATLQIKPIMGFNFVVPLFASTILGGVGKPFGALLGSLIVALSMELSTAVLLPTYKSAVAFAIMLLILLVKPRGLTGEKN